MTHDSRGTLKNRDVFSILFFQQKVAKNEISVHEVIEYFLTLR